MKSVEREFEWVRKTLFPYWDRRRSWRLLVEPHEHHEFEIDTANRRLVWRGRVPSDPVRLRAFLVNLIAHPVSQHRNEEWLQTVDKASARARKLGEALLADAIDKEYPPIDASDIYRLMATSVDHLPDLPFSAVEKLVAVHYGMPLGEFRAKFPRAREVFDKARGGATPPCDGHDIN